MVSELSLTPAAKSHQAKPESFSAQSWLEYFQENRENRITFHFPNDASMTAEMRIPLIRSLQRFQIGETGEGNHLRKYASGMNDQVYEQCIDMFIKEEQNHARILGEMIAGLDGTLLTWHWTDLAFIVLRRMLGLKTELFILLIAEIVGKCFYLECARKLDNTRMSDAFSLIVLDEIAHLQFHCEFLQTQVAHYPVAARKLVRFCWATIFYTALFVFVIDHRRTLKALSNSSNGFVAECGKEFDRAASQALLLPRKSPKNV